VKDGNLVGFVGSCMELPSNSILYDVALKEQSSGMLDRFAVEQLVRTYVERGKTQNNPLSLMVFDLDNFKKFVHAYGEEAGEVAIGIITEAVKGALRNSDALGSLNKNQFVIVMPNTELKDTLAIADRLRKMIASLLMDVGGLPVRITATFGVTEWRATEIDLLWANVHKALQEAKQRGKNCVSKYP
jgi:diguanylate cyclase (GGDEF)-like protein